MNANLEHISNKESGVSKSRLKAHLEIVYGCCPECLEDEAFHYTENECCRCGYIRKLFRKGENT